MTKQIVRIVVIVSFALSAAACSTNDSTPATKMWVNQSPRISSCAMGDRQAILNQADETMSVDDYLDSVLSAYSCIAPRQ